MGTKNHIYVNERMVERDLTPHDDEVIRIDSYQSKKIEKEDIEE